MSAHRDLVMEHRAIVHKLDRMAREILEVHYQESNLFLIGVDGQGVAVCNALASRLRALSDVKVSVGTLSMHKDLPLEQVDKYYKLKVLVRILYGQTQLP